jgi:filamentous hemagglutinin
MAQLTGRRFLPGYTDDEIQFLALMNNATTVAKDLQLRPGIALSAEQVALLTSDIVWLVEQDVTLPDGSTTRVLVPKVYARIKEGDLEADGTLISGRSITARLQGDLSNSGLITADQNVVVTAENIHNLKGSIEGRDVRLYADIDINNTGGRIAATDRLKLQAGRDINVQSTTQTTETVLSESEAARGNRFTRTQIDRVAGVYVTGSENTNAGSNTNTDNTLNLTAGRNVTLSCSPNPKHQRRHHHHHRWRTPADHHRHHRSRRQSRQGCQQPQPHRPPRRSRHPDQHYRRTHTHRSARPDPAGSDCHQWWRH